jgi:hypothetical protein
MCVLCAQLVNEIHWSERQLKPEWISRGTGEAARRRDRRARVRLIRAVLAHYGLEIADDWSATNYLLGDRKGNQQVLASLGELWPAASRMAGRVLDPLDERLLDRLAKSMDTHA